MTSPPPPFDSDEFDELPEVLTTEQAARLLDASVPKTQRWAAEGRIPSTRIGHTYRFSKTRLATWLGRPEHD